MLKQLQEKIFKNILRILPKALNDSVPRGIKETLLMKYYLRDFYIDILGSCNLACPSCPAAGIKMLDGSIQKNRGGKMSIKMFEKIVDRIAQEHPGTQISLFNWTDPLVRPDFEKFMEAIHSRGLKSCISTNLNILRDPDGFAKIAPQTLIISLSGFSQSIYEQGHQSGDIEVVKDNMRKLSEAYHKANAPLKSVTIYFHKYVYNLHEASLMKDYVTSLGFSFRTSWAYYMPIERVFSYMENQLPELEKKYIESKFVLNIKKVINAGHSYKNKSCQLKRTTNIDCRGEVQLCCAIYDTEKFSLGPYLETSTKDIAKKVLNHNYCKTECAKHSLDIYANWHALPISSVYEANAQDELRKKGLDKNGRPLAKEI